MCGTAEGQLRDVVLRGESAAAERVLHEEKLGGVQAFCLDHDSDFVALINDYGQLTVMEDTPPPSMTL